MSLLYSQLINQKVCTVQTSSVIAYTSGLIIDYSKFKVSLIKLMRLKSHQTAYLLPGDVRNFSNSSVMVNSESALSDEEDLIRYQKLIRNSPELIGYKVVTLGGKNLGRCSDYSFDAPSFLISKIFVKQNVILRLTQNNLIIDRQDIIKITPKEVIVKDTLTPAVIKLKTALPAENP